MPKKSSKRKCSCGHPLHEGPCRYKMTFEEVVNSFCVDQPCYCQKRTRIKRDKATPPDLRKMSSQEIKDFAMRLGKGSGKTLMNFSIMEECLLALKEDRAPRKLNFKMKKVKI